LESDACWQRFADAARQHIRETFDLTRQTLELEQIYTRFLPKP
jgi:hypothetical protein